MPRAKAVVDIAATVLVMEVDNRTKKYLIWNTDFKEYVIT